MHPLVSFASSRLLQRTRTTRNSLPSRSLPSSRMFLSNLRVFFAYSSHPCSLDSMSGQFNASVQSQIAGTSTAPLATPSAASSTAGSSGSSKITTTTSHSGSATSSSTAKSTSTSAASSAGRNVAVNGAMGVMGALALVAGYVL